AAGHRRGAEVQVPAGDYQRPTGCYGLRTYVDTVRARDRRPIRRAAGRVNGSADEQRLEITRRTEVLRFKRFRSEARQAAALRELPPQPLRGVVSTRSIGAPLTSKLELALMRVELYGT